MDEMDVKALNVGRKLWVFVQELFSLPPIVFRLPEFDNFAQEVGVNAVVLLDSFQGRCEWAVIFKSLLQVY